MGDIANVQGHIDAHGWAVIWDVLDKEELKKEQRSILDAVRVYLYTDRPDVDDDKLMEYYNETNDELYRNMYSIKERESIRFFQNGSRKRNATSMRQGQDGVTKTSGMFDLYALDPTNLPKMAATVEAALGRTVYFNKERFSIRGHKSSRLQPHIDSPCGLEKQ